MTIKSNVTDATSIFLITARPRMVPNRAWNVEQQVDRLPLMVSLSTNRNLPSNPLARRVCEDPRQCPSQ